MARKLPRFLTLREVKAMFKAAEGNQRDQLILKCLFYLGLRNSEVRNMRIEDMDLINRNVKVVSGKGKKDRYIPLPKSLLKPLEKWIGDREEGLLFPGRSEDNKISGRHLRRIVKKYAKRAWVRKPDEVHPHTLRHSYATYLQNKGVPLNVIQRVLGHANVETTTIYAHLGIDRIRGYIDEVF